MQNWTITKRIVAGFSIIVALSAIMGMLAWNSMRVIGEQANELASDTIPGLALQGTILQNQGTAHLTLIRHVLATRPEEKQAYETVLKDIAETNATLLGELEKTCNTPEERDYVQKMKQARQDYVAARGPILQISNAGKNDEAMAELLKSGRATYNALVKISSEFVSFESKGATSAANAIQLRTKSSKIMLASVVLGELAISTFLGFLVVAGLNRVLKRVSSSLGDGAEQVTSAAGQVSSSSQTLAEGASEQAASLEETSSSLEEMSSMTKRNADNAQKANELAKQARSAADKGAGDMKTMSAAMEAIKISSDDIAKIIKTIDEIAFQTNILALNAAVEAARAGEAGMGFAVVADEVRNLAQRSAQAAKETAGKIEGAIAKTGQGVDISSKVAATLNEIVTKVRQVDELVAEVAGASREQTQGITQINTAVGQMDKVTQSNAANAEESAAAAEELNAQAETMKQSVAELLQLVGGRNQVVRTGNFAPASRARESRPAAPKAKRSAPIHGNGNGNSHGNGHGEPAMSGKTNGRNQIPLEGDFSSF